MIKKKGLKLLLFIFICAVAMLYLRFGCEKSIAISVTPLVVGSASTDSVRINFGTIDTTYYPAVLDADSLIILIYPPDNAAPESTADGGTGVFNLTTGYYQYHRRGSNATPDVGIYTVCVKAWRGSAVRGIGTCSYLVTGAGTYHYGVQDSTRDLVKDSVANAILDANKPNFKATGFATAADGDSVIQAIADANKANFHSSGDTIQREASVLTALEVWSENLSGYITAHWAGTYVHALFDSQDWNPWDNPKTDTTTGMGDWFADWFNANYWLTATGFAQAGDAMALTTAERKSFADTLSHRVYDTLYAHRGQFYNWSAAEKDDVYDTLMAIYDTIKVHAPHGDDWGQGGGNLVAITDTVNAILDTIQAHAPHGNDWGQGGGSLAAITDTVNALLDTLQAGFGSQTNQGDMVKISGDGTAADNLETMLDGTGGQKLSLASLEIRASGDDTALIAVGSGGGYGVFVLGGATAQSGGIFKSTYTSGSGLVAQGKLYGLYAYSAATSGTHAGFFADHGPLGTGYDISADIHGTIDSAHRVGGGYVDSVDTIISPVSAVSCAGWGAYTVTLYLLNDADSTAVKGVNINIYDSTSGVWQAGHVTPANGIRQFSLDASTYTIHLQDPPNAITSPQYMTISADTTDTFWVDVFDPGTPPSGDQCRVWCLVPNLSANWVVGCRLSVEIPSRYYPVLLGKRPVYSHSVSGVSNDTGYVYVDVYESGELTGRAGKGTVKMDIKLVAPNGRLIIRTKQPVEIPDAASWEIEW